MIEIKERGSNETIEKMGDTSKIRDYLRNIKEIVKKVCDDSENASNNDMWLCIEYWGRSKEGDIKEYAKDGERFVSITFRKKDISKITKPESISRARRELRKEGKIRYSEEMEKLRERGKSDFKEYYGKDRDSEDFQRKTDEWVF